MVTCNICINGPVSPVCLPCGHIFCNDCLFRGIRAIAPFTTMHHCPACQIPYSTATLDPVIVPPHLRANLLPSVRTLQLGEPSTATPQPSGTAVDLEIENARLRAENAAMQKNCAMWRKRAEAHSSSTLGLLQLVRMAREQAIQLARQRDELRIKCEALCNNDDIDDLDKDDDPLETGNEPFLPITILDQVGRQRKNSSPLSIIELSSPEGGLGLTSLKRVRTPYESPCSSDGEDDERPNKRIRVGSVPLSPLPDFR
ncbi:hypothetical protein AX15_001022 [Amanita polypyramis BW_CC]|nr:hypothetical protein AX15_001022 [Amanita polypyramis BW_CC]